MKNLSYIISGTIALFASLLLSCQGGSKQAGTKEDIVYEVEDEHLPIADPYILCHDNKYYAYGTHTNGFGVFISDDLRHWKRGPIVLSPENSWGTRWYWAPEVYYIASKQKFFMFYSVDEHICVATSDSPEGPFVQKEKKPITDEKGIDTSLFIDENGKAYLYYVRFTDGNVIWVAEMNDDLTSIKEETLTQCISATQPWELLMGKVTEGPSVFKKDGLYYLLYSANDYRSLDYSVGYATAKSPFGPWEKAQENPILKRGMANTAGLSGTGHGAPFKDYAGNDMYVFHAHQNDTTIHPRNAFINDKLVVKDGKVTIEGEVITPVIVR